MIEANKEIPSLHVIASVTEWSVAISRDYFVAPLLVMTKIHHYYPPTDGDKVPSPPLSSWNGTK